VIVDGAFRPFEPDPFVPHRLPGHPVDLKRAEGPTLEAEVHHSGDFPFHPLGPVKPEGGDLDDLPKEPSEQVETMTPRGSDRPAPQALSIPNPVPRGHLDVLIVVHARHHRHA